MISTDTFATNWWTTLGMGFQWANVGMVSLAETNSWVSSLLGLASSCSGGFLQSWRGVEGHRVCGNDAHLSVQFNTSHPHVTEQGVFRPNMSPSALLVVLYSDWYSLGCQQCEPLPNRALINSGQFVSVWANVLTWPTYWNEFVNIARRLLLVDSIVPLFHHHSHLIPSEKWSKKFDNKRSGQIWDITGHFYPTARIIGAYSILGKGKGRWPNRENKANNRPMVAIIWRRNIFSYLKVRFGCSIRWK